MITYPPAARRFVGKLSDLRPYLQRFFIGKEFCEMSIPELLDLSESDDPVLADMATTEIMERRTKTPRRTE